MFYNNYFNNKGGGSIFLLFLLKIRKVNQPCICQEKSHNYFDSLSVVQKAYVIQYIQSNNATGDHARKKINDVVTSLKNNSLDFTL